MCHMPSKRKLFISVYAIAKDEEKTVRRWYDNFKEADELCVLVNNTTDKTAEILCGLGVKVVEKRYDKFRYDVARNEAMAICNPKADLLFCTDIDDTIEKGWRKKIEHAWELGKETGKNPNSILYKYAVGYAGGKQYFVRHNIHTPKGWYWKSRIHEYLEGKDKKVFIYYPKFVVTSKPTRREHGAYLSMLEEECRSPDCDARNMHLLGREYLNHKRYEEAIEWFQKHLANIGAIWDAERAASMKFMSDCYAALGYANAHELWLWKAMCEYPADRDASYTLGKVLMAKKEWRTAVAVLEKCVAIEEPDITYPFFNLDAWTEHPWVCLAEAYYYIGEWDKARKAIARAREINPGSKIGTKIAEEMETIFRSGARPPRPPREVPRERIEIPELIS